MSFSLNEVQAMAKRAARGAGLDWGMAEEAAWATRWLCRAGLPGVGILADLLTEQARSQKDDFAPKSLQSPWQGTAGVLSPLCAGPTLSDVAQRLREAPIQLEQVSEPLMMLPFASAAAAQLDHPVSLRWRGGEAVVSRSGLRLIGGRGGESDILVELAERSPMAALQPLSEGRADPGSDAWAQLGELAHRTYAPATEESRLLGAGAGLSDND